MGRVMEQEATPKLALIDVGSNTIRTVVYGLRGTHARKLYSEREYVGLIAYVRDGRLSDEGVARLCATLAHMKRFCALCRCARVTAFSTASLRGVANRAEAVAEVRRLTGLDILPLSAEEEMACDCAALLRLGLREGFAFDLGGGSCQVFRFREEGVREGASLPFGCLTLGHHPPTKRGLLLSLRTSFVIMGYTLADGFGAQHSGDAIGYACWIFVLNIFPLHILILCRNGRDYLHYLRGRALPGLSGGACGLASYGIAIWAMTQAPIALVAALRETSVIFGMLLAIVFLGERFSPLRALAVVLVACGGMVLRLA